MALQEQLKQKRIVLESGFIHFENLIQEGKLSINELRKRYERLTNLIDSYEQLYVKCTDINDEVEGVDDLCQLVERYHVIGDKIYSSDTAAVNNTSGSNRDNDTMNTRDQQIQLRRIEIPRFDGDMEKWLPFKSSFLTLVSERRDMSDLEKHVYLRGALSGEAFQTIQHYPLTGECYKAAWEALLTEFDIPQRILLARAFDALIDIPRPKTMSVEDIKSFLNELRSHIFTISTFNNPVALQVRLAERALPPAMLREWDKQAGSDEYPTIEQFFDFLTRFTRSSAPSQALPRSASIEPRAKRRYPETRTLRPRKRQNTYPTHKFLTHKTTNCILCKRANHPLYRCPRYNNMTKVDRWDTVMHHELCENCLCKHQEQCNKASRCQICHQPHHTSLHLDCVKHETMKQEN